MSATVNTPATSPHRTNRLGALRRRAATAAVTLVAASTVLTVAPGPAEAAPTGVWDRLAACESSGRWHIDTGNGYYGGLQFSASTWRAFGGGRYAAMPHHATKAQQIKVAERVRKHQGWGAWPACSSRLGLR